MNKSIFKNSVYKFFLEAFRVLIPIISMPYIYRIFDPKIIGEIEFSKSVLGYFIIFASFGVYSYGIRELSRIRNCIKTREKLFTELFLISVISSIVTTCIYFLYVIIKFDKNILVRNIFLINSINLIAYSFYIEWVNEAFENYTFIAVKTIIIRMLNLIFIFIIIRVPSDFYKYLILLNLFNIVNNLLSFIYLKSKLNLNFKNLNIRRHFMPLFTLILISNVNILYSELDKILLGFYGKNIEEVAYYTIGQKVMVIVGVITVTASVIVPRLSFFIGQNKMIEYERMLNRVCSYLSLILFPVCVGIIILSKEIVLLLGGDAYLLAKISVMIFAVRMIPMTIEIVLSNHILYLHKKEHIMVLILGICGIFNLIIKILLILSNNLTTFTALCSTTVSEILIILLEMYYIKKYLTVQIYFLKLNNMKYLFISLLFFPIGYFIHSFNLHYLIVVLLDIFVCASLYFIILVTTKDKCILKILKRISVRS